MKVRGGEFSTGTMGNFQSELTLGRLEEARATFDQAEAKKLDSLFLRIFR